MTCFFDKMISLSDDRVTLVGLRIPNISEQRSLDKDYLRNISLYNVKLFPSLLGY